jgi:hypothetical protein
VRSQVILEDISGPSFQLSGRGSVGRYVLETSSPLGQWHVAGTNLTSTGLTIWQLLNVSSNAFFRLRQE